MYNYIPTLLSQYFVRDSSHRQSVGRGHEFSRLKAKTLLETGMMKSCPIGFNCAEMGITDEGCLNRPTCTEAYLSL